MAVQQDLGLGIPDAASFDSFHPGPNATLVRQLREWSTDSESGQVFLVGPAGSGKTHLAQAACRARWQAGLQAAYLPLDALADLAGGLDGLPLASLIAVDGLESLTADDELRLMRLIDACRVEHGRLLFAARNWPRRLDLSIPDLRSRLQWGAVFELRALDDEGLAALIRQRCRQRGVEMNDRTIEFLLKRVRRDAGTVLSMFESAYALAVRSGRQLTVPLIRELLAERALSRTDGG